MTVPQPYAEGTRTDELRDPELASASTSDDEPNPFQLPQYRDRSSPTRTGSSYGSYQTWVIVAVVLLVLRILLALIRER
jgi:hypothetical protein